MKIDFNQIDSSSVEIPPIFAQHLVSIGCWDKTPAVLAANGGEPALYSFSGFVVSINGTSWSLMTAGHPIRELESYIQKGRTFSNWHIDDSPGQMPPGGLPVPFTWDPESIAVLHDDSRGFDFALIPLNENQQALLASNGVVPITESEIADIFAENFDRWYLLGLPGEKAQPNHVRQVIEKQFMGLPVQPLDEKPVWWVDKDQRNLRYGQLIPVGNPEVDSLDVKGMSGGPVIGLRVDAGGKPEWKVIGIQSGWAKSHRVISVCAAWPIFDAIGRMIDDVRNSSADTGENPPPLRVSEPPA